MVSLTCVLFGGMFFQGLPADHKDQMVDALPLLKDRLKKTDANVLFSAVNDLAKVQLTALNTCAVFV